MEGDNLERVLKPFMELGYVELFSMFNKTQYDAIDHCVNLMREHLFKIYFYFII